jgi:hypothetical protein
MCLSVHFIYTKVMYVQITHLEINNALSWYHFQKTWLQTILSYLPNE